MTPANLYERIGGDVAVRTLVDRFYDIMDLDPALKPLRDLHAKSLRVSRDKLYEFLSGWMGGPPLYAEKHGHPRLRARHMPFAIDRELAGQWMQCMHQALQDSVADVRLRGEITYQLEHLADHMRNIAESAEEALNPGMRARDPSIESPESRPIGLSPKS